MSIWERIKEALAALSQGESLASVFDRLTSPPQRSVAFTIAIIALGAKMAKADGLVTRDEVTAFREIFVIAESEEANAARIFDLARQDVAGFDSYARQVARMFRDDPDTLADVLEGLFHIAAADGVYHPGEDQFLTEVAQIFGIPDQRFDAMRIRFAHGPENDPYAILGVAPEDDDATIRAAWRRLVQENHPDRMMARGVPEEALKLATNRLADINKAWDVLSTTRGL